MQLMNQTHFTLQFIGTGNARSKPPHNYNTNAIIRVNGCICLLDCGLLCPLALHTIGIPLTNIDAVIISHLHGDHVLGLEELLFSNFFQPTPRRVSLWLPDGLLARGSAPPGYDIWENCLRASLETTLESNQTSRVLAFDDYADIHMMTPPNAYDICGISCEPFPVVHIKNRPAYGFILNNCAAFTADCTFSRNCIENLLNKGVHTIFHDVTFIPYAPGAVHTTFEELATLPRDIAEHIYLMHYADDIPQHAVNAALSKGFRFAQRDAVYAF
jgi:ribonuclease BN (tRNA processing enzyme)